MRRIWVLLQKEWLELRQDRLILLGTFGPAIFLTLVPLLGMWAVRHAPDAPPNDNTTLAEANPALLGLGGREFGQAILGQQLSVLFFLLPLIIPSVIAAYSVVGEKAGSPRRCGPGNSCWARPSPRSCPRSPSPGSSAASLSWAFAPSPYRRAWSTRSSAPAG
jgi:hypothetical protein